MKDFLKKAADTIVQTVRDYPKGTLIAWGVTLILAKVF